MQLASQPRTAKVDRAASEAQPNHAKRIGPHGTGPVPGQRLVHRVPRRSGEALLSLVVCGSCVGHRPQSARRRGRTPKRQRERTNAAAAQNFGLNE